MSFSLSVIVRRLAAGNFEHLAFDRAQVAKHDAVTVREVEVAYAEGCLLRVRANGSFSFWEELQGLIKANDISLQELGTNQQEMRRLRRTVDVAHARWALSCFRGSLIQMHRINLARIMGTRGVRYADIGTTRDEVRELELRAKAA